MPSIVFALTSQGITSSTAVTCTATKADAMKLFFIFFFDNLSFFCAFYIN